MRKFLNNRLGVALQVSKPYLCTKGFTVQRALLYFIAGTALSFLLQHFLLQSQGWEIDLYNGFAFGLGWAFAYLVDHPEWSLAKKLGISLIGIAAIVLIGFIFFSFETAVPSIIKFSTIFVGYYLIASFRESKSLRN